MSDITINLSDDPTSGDPDHPYRIDLRDGAHGLDDVGIELGNGVTLIVNLEQLEALRLALVEWWDTEEEA